MMDAGNVIVNGDHAILILGAFAVVLGLFKLRESLFVIRQT
ncbi:MAG TPA: hypothetical protein VFU08_08275 [Candidatus Udaeobacter sp.]|nr:hypothetical protein [Candidatus Udaeobacter sp.]